MNPRQRVLAIATDGAGAATVNDSVQISGRIVDVRYVPDGSVPMTGTPVLTLTSLGDASQGGATQSIWAETLASPGSAAQRAPRQATHGATGAAALYAAGGTGVLDKFVMANETLKLTVSGGGASKKGTVVVTLE